MSALEQFIRMHDQHEAEGGSLRCGQHFVARYIKGNWPRLFYATSTIEALVMIANWLRDHQYTDDLPPDLGRLTQLSAPATDEGTCDP